MQREGPGRRRLVPAFIAVAVAAALPYAGTVRHEFVFDDGPEVVDNEAIRSLANMPSFFAQSAWRGSGQDNPIYRPLTTASYAVNRALFGSDPWSFHALNVLLHALASVLVLALGAELGIPPEAAFGAAVLFAVHPVHVEAVANVAGRKDLLVCLFALAAVLAHARAVRRGGIALAAAPLAVLAAAFSKESGLASVAVILARDLLYAREAWRSSRARLASLYAVYGSCAALHLWARWAAVGSLAVPIIPFAENPAAHAPEPVRVLTAVAMMGRGMALLIAPVALSPDYSHDAIRPVASPGDPWFLLGALAVAGAIVVAARAWRRAPAASFAVLWYLATLFPASNLLVPIGTIFGERLLYVPSVGFALGAGLGLAWLEARARAPVRWLGAAALLVLAWRAEAYASVWRDELTLFTWGVRAQPRSAKMRQCLGAAFMERGRPLEALPHFIAAVEISRANPERPARHLLELGVAYEALHRLDEAAAVYERILHDDPSYSDALWRLGVVRWAAGSRAEAVATWRRTLEIDPHHARALSDLGIAASASGDWAAAEQSWERAVAADPRLASAWYRLGNLYERRGEMDRARLAWSEFLKQAGPKQARERDEVAAKIRSARPRVP